MKDTCKKIAAVTLSLAIIAGNAGFSPKNSHVLTSKAAEPSHEWMVNDDDETYYDAKTKTVHLKGSVSTSYFGTGLLLPDEFVNYEEIETVVAEKGTILPQDCSYLFYCLPNLKLVDLRNADASHVTDMSYMFFCPFRETDWTFDYIYFGSPDTSNVTNMEGMFKNCIAPYYDISSFNTSKVTNMSEMFAESGWTYKFSDSYSRKNRLTCTSEIDLSSFDTSSVTDMSGMFRNSYFPRLDLRGFDTSQVTDMSAMFKGCIYLDYILADTWDTSNVTDMSEMFRDTYNSSKTSEFREIDLSSFNTGKVTDMSYMFGNTLFNELDLSNFDTRNVTSMKSMFDSSKYLRKINMSGFDTHKVTDMSSMFANSGCHDLDLKNFYITDDTNIENMFTNCRELCYLTLPYGWTKEKLLKKDSYILQNCPDELAILNTGYGTYYDARTETLHLKGNVMTNSSGIGLLIPDGVKKEDIKVVTADEGTVLPNNCSHLFEGLTELRAVYLKNADTSSVTDMSYMFDNAARYYSKLEYIDLTNCDTSNVTTMEGMFMNCQYAIFTLDGIDTSNVTNMSKMFAECGWLEYIAERFYGPSDDPHESYPKVLDLRSFDTSSVTNMSGMFDGAAYRSVNLSSFNTSKVTDMSDMFKGCIMLESLDLQNFDTSNVTDMSGMFQDTYSDLGFLGYYNDDLHGLEEIDLSNFDTSNVTNMSNMFAASGFKDLDLSSFDTGNVTDMSCMFSSCSRLNKFNIKSFDTRNVKNMTGMFSNLFMDLIDIHHFTISDDTDFSYMFCNSSKARSYGTAIIPNDWTAAEMAAKDITVFWASNADSVTVIESKDESYYDTKTKTLHLKGYVRNSDNDGMILPKGVKREEIKALVAEKGTVLPQDSKGLFAYMEALESADLKNADTSFVHDMSHMFNECRFLTSLDLSSWDTSNVKNMSDMFMCVSNLKSLDLSNFNTSKVTNFAAMFWNEYSNLQSLDLSSFDTSKATDMHLMFFGCKSLKSLDLSSFNTSNVTDMVSMFCGCESLTSLDISNFDTSRVVSMRDMFRGCSSLKTLDLSSFNTPKLGNISYMFANCSSLKTICVSEKWDPSNISYFREKDYPPHIHRVGLDDVTETFDDCKALVGGAGTAYKSGNTSGSYAIIDGGKSDPGYFTLKYDKNDYFKTQNLVLSGKIGVSFNLDLSSLSDKEKAASYMEFTVNCKTSTVKFNKDSVSPSGKYYSFTCYVTSVEMADDITAVFHFGSGKSVSKTYSVLEYISKIDENAKKYDKYTLDLVHAIADYGHYSQPFLAASNNWTVGREHKAMDKYYTSSYSYDAVKKTASKYERVLALGKSDIEKITYSLSLNTDTTVNVFIKPRSSYSGSIKVTTQKGKTATSYTAVKQSDGRYKVTIPNISAHQLGDKYTITAVTSSGTASCSLSALSYVYAILDGSSDKTAKNAVSALCRYYEATINYRNNA